ncbi:hypothetical protein SAMN05421823_112164 [Catalinimonas alkaloidigena]|uniref:Outer membrane protein beta-barrel domain-containing protein n=1 Tax=Catalinimonas alkaloidigena TaxID=1075417 RepID=A0A1G9SH54_9BACT|nr:hypothetical protein [Catalinimonas alkaloidigena]SDM34814.1 hypothetical protein SAMN05421823_112164 [Catalinimonas alkaloidigena]
MKKFWILLFAMAPLGLFAQSADHTTNATPEEEVEYYNPEHATELEKITPSRWHYATNIGASFFTGAWGSGFNTYVAPQVSYDLNDRWQLHGGLALVNTTMPFGYANAEGSQAAPFARNRVSTMAYVGGSYQASERLLLSGYAYYDMLTSNYAGAPAAFTQPNMGASFNAEYKVTKNFSIGVGVSSRRGNGYGMYGSPYGGSPYGYGPGMGSFGSPYGGFAPRPYGW